MAHKYCKLSTGIYSPLFVGEISFRNTQKNSVINVTVKFKYAIFRVNSQYYELRTSEK